MRRTRIFNGICPAGIDGFAKHNMGLYCHPTVVYTGRPSILLPHLSNPRRGGLHQRSVYRQTINFIAPRTILSPRPFSRRLHMREVVVERLCGLVQEWVCVPRRSRQRRVEVKARAEGPL